MAKKNSGKKRNKVDPILLLAERNKQKSITVAQDEQNKKSIRNNAVRRQPRVSQEDNDPFIADLDADRLFQEMKRRDF